MLWASSAAPLGSPPPNLLTLCWMFYHRISCFDIRLVVFKTPLYWEKRHFLCENTPLNISLLWQYLFLRQANIHQVGKLVPGANTQIHIKQIWKGKNDDWDNWKLCAVNVNPTQKYTNLQKHKCTNIQIHKKLIHKN